MGPSGQNTSPRQGEGLGPISFGADSLSKRRASISAKLTDGPKLLKPQAELQLRLFLSLRIVAIKGEVGWGCTNCLCLKKCFQENLLKNRTRAGRLATCVALSWALTL